MGPFKTPRPRGPSALASAAASVSTPFYHFVRMSTAGGEISKSAANLDAQLINIPFDKLQIKSGGFGILDVVFLRDSNQAWGARRTRSRW